MFSLHFYITLHQKLTRNDVPNDFRRMSWTGALARFISTADIGTLQQASDGHAKMWPNSGDERFDFYLLACGTSTSPNIHVWFRGFIFLF